MLVLFGVGPLDILVEVNPGDWNPFIEALVEVVEIAVELTSALGLFNAEDFGATGLAIFEDLGDASDSVKSASAIENGVLVVKGRRT